MPLTIDVPEDLAERFRQLPEPERDEWAAAALRSVLEEAQEQQEILMALQEGLAEFRAGQTLSLEESLAQSLAVIEAWKKRRAA